jgi:hypothetical protein
VNTISVIFDEAFKYGDGTKCWGCVVKISESLFVEFCNLRNVISLWYI